MKKLFLIALITSVFSQVQAQKVSVAGLVQDSLKEGLAYTTVCLLAPEDSTLKYFALTNDIGGFILKDVEAGNYLMQINRLGYINYYKTIKEGDLKADLLLGNIELKEAVYNLNGVNIYGEQAPVVIKGDTVEYNAKSFKTQNTDNVENLLKKLPGVEVDRDGNIKAQGETVQKVMVDGKEFFGSNPKMATKNLSAKSIDKVQVFDKKSDLSEFTGDDDGETTKVINLQLKDEFKTGGFGEVTAGVGTDDRYKGKANFNRFSKKSQISLLGSINNINQTGMSVDEFINFNGGLSNLMRGGQAQVNISGNSSPINTGETQPGDLTSGYIGGNINLEPTKKLKVNLNYLGDANWLKTIENSVSKQFIQGSTFNQLADNTQKQDRFNNTANTRIESNPDSLNRFIVTASTGLGSSKVNGYNTQQNFNDEDVLLNQLNAQNISNNSSFNGSVQANYIKKSALNKGQYLNAELAISYYDADLAQTWANENITAPNYVSSNNFTDRADYTQNNTYSGELLYSFPLTEKFSVRPQANVRQLGKQLHRNQNLSSTSDNIEYFNSVKQNILSTELGTSLRWNLEKWNINTKIAGENLDYSADVFLQNSNTDNYQFNKWYFTPSVSARYKLSRFKFIRLRYNTGLNAPNLSQTNTFVDASNPQRVVMGNVALNPEYNHQLSGTIRLYDAFSFTSFYTTLSGDYTDNKITQVLNTDTNLRQTVSYTNFKNQQSVSISSGFNTPIRKLGIKLDLSLSERISNGYSIVDGTTNQLNTYNHGFGAAIDNRTKDKLDWVIGSDFSITQARYSLSKNQNTNYLSQSYYADVEYFIIKDLSVGVSFDYTQYKNSQLDKSTFIPLLKANVNYTFLPTKNATLSLEGFDLLKQNKVVNQYSVNNLLGETRSNVIQQYFMLSFTYKINAQNNTGPSIPKHMMRMR